MTVEEVKEEVQRIWFYLDEGYNVNDPEDLKERLAVMTSYFSWVNNRIAPMKRKYMEAKRNGLMEIAENAKVMKMAKKMQEGLVDSVCAEHFENWDELVRLDRALSKNMAAVTSILSYAKQEMYLSRQQPT